MAVFGTRPDTIKMMPVVEAMKARPGDFELFSLSTGQHRQMLDDVLRVFGVEPDLDLDIMRPDQTLSDIVTRGLPAIGAAIRDISPDLVLVHGDTSTGFTASLAAFYAGVKSAHVEAGLRTFDKWNPFPEEMNRKLIGSLADLHFAPLKTHRSNLLAEGAKPDGIYVTGNTAVDAVLRTSEKVKNLENTELEGAILGPGRLILVTAHRRESIGAGIEGICLAVKRILDEYKDVRVLFPVHPNPRVSGTVHRILDGESRCHLVSPMSYPDMVLAMKSSYFCMSDSGGIQEEAPSLGKPVLVLRECTERPEGVAAGTLKLAGVSPDRIFELASRLLEDEGEYRKMAGSRNPFGDGKASSRIVQAILHSAGLASRPADYE